MSISIEKLPGNPQFGQVVRGIRREDIDDPEIQSLLREMWIKEGLLIFADTDATPQTQIALSRVFGDLALHPNAEAHVEGMNELVHLRYSPSDGDLYLVDGEVRGGYIPWHSDLIYVDRINRGGILRPVLLPENGGQTGFIDQIEAFRRLPEELKREIDDKYIVYHSDFNAEHKEFGKRVKRVRAGSLTERINARAMSSPRVLHPAVYIQRETGRKVLNISPWFAVEIAGDATAKGNVLLETLIEHCESTEQAYFHEWKEGDMLLWDNWRMLHCAMGVPESDQRHMQRTTIEGDYAMGRLEGACVSDDPF